MVAGNEHDYSDAVNEIEITGAKTLSDASSEMEFGSTGVIDNWRRILSNIQRACEDCGRRTGDAQLVCVTKTADAARIQPILAAGQREFGENRVQEAAAKWPALQRQFPDLRLHLIGPLQTNKVREAAALFDVIETLDREKLAAALATEFQRAGMSRELYIQVNTGSEPQKAGLPPADVDHFVTLCRKTYQLNITGLMCIPPLDQHASPHFAMLSQMAERNGISRLSMGMSSDFELAIQLGATHVRVGSAIFGTRG